ncbi:hypothetical protein ACFOSD_13920 [Salinispirillum marinum]|uniref:Porin domain-containing protein n=2 Tax=Saccharospirillaceae TaxID=255527 RepID=A0ABV8BHA4_9GAMM
MKAFKLASGFAVSALTLAIAGTAVAEATTEMSYTGSVRVQTVFDLEAESRENQLPGYAAADEDWYNFNITTTVKHGPMSGKIRVGIHEDEKAGGSGWSPTSVTNDKNNGYVRVFDLRVDEGAVSFGQIGDIADTVGKLEGLTDFDTAAETALDAGLGVKSAARYTVADLGLKVQAEGNDVADFGFAAAVHQDLGVAQVWADFQYREPDGGNSDVDAITGLGVAVEASPIDALTIEGAFRNNSGADDSAWAAKATFAVSDTISVYGQVASISTENERMAVRAGGSAAFAPITVEGWFATDLTEDAEDTRVFGKVSYAEGAIGAYGEAKMGLGEGQGLEAEVGGSYTTESGVKYGAEYAMGDVADEDSEASKATVYAEYSF